MRPYGAPRDTRRLTLTVIALVCTFALSIGFLTGRFYAESQEPAVSAGPALATHARKAVGRRPKAICADTCSQANNGICEDERALTSPQSDWLTPRTVLCDLGTDCSDCGPWQPSGPVSWDTMNASAGPIAQLHAHHTDVRSRQTVTHPPFLFAYTDPKLDVDVSYYVDAGGGVELHITKIYKEILEGRCVRPDGSRALFIDVGSNFGWFAIYAAKLGCRVAAFEPVPLFRHFLEYNIHLNGLASLITVHTHLISHESGKMTEIQVPGKGIWGTAGIGGLNIDPNIQSGVEKLMLPTAKLEDLLAEDALLMKVDVEGWEWSVLAGAAGLLKGHWVENIILEYSPGVFERHRRHDDTLASIQMLANLLDLGYKIGHIGDEQKGFLETLDWSMKIAPMREVTAENLQYDRRDAIAYKEERLGCPAPPSLGQFRPWTLCQSIPEDLSPFSFRSVIGHNTNIWASRNTTLLPLSGRVGILDLDVPPRQYFVAEGAKFGMGGRLCSDVSDEVAVRHRCRCKVTAPCVDEYMAVEALVNAGWLASNLRMNSSR